MFYCGLQPGNEPHFLTNPLDCVFVGFGVPLPPAKPYILFPFQFFQGSCLPLPSFASTDSHTAAARSRFIFSDDCSRPVADFNMGTNGAAASAVGALNQHELQRRTDASASPTWTSSTAHLTPDSDSDSDRGEARHGLPPPPLAAEGELGGSEVYELQDFHVEKPTGAYDDDDDDDDDDGDEQPGYGFRSDAGTTRRRLSESTAASFQLYTPDEEQAIVRKFDRRLVLFLSVCYMLAFLDRSSACLPH